MTIKKVLEFWQHESRHPTPLRKYTGFFPLGNQSHLWEFIVLNSLSIGRKFLWEPLSAKDCLLIMSRGGSGGRTVQGEEERLVIPLQCTDFRGVETCGGRLEPSPRCWRPSTLSPSVGTHWPRRKCIVPAQILPDVTGQRILVFKSSITQRWLTWDMTSSWTP